MRKKETLTVQQKDQLRTGFEPVPRCTVSVSFFRIFLGGSQKDVGEI